MEPTEAIRSEPTASRDWPSYQKSLNWKYQLEAHYPLHADTGPFSCYFPNCGKRCSSLDPVAPMAYSPVLFAQPCPAERATTNVICDTCSHPCTCKWPNCQNTFTRRINMRRDAEVCYSKSSILTPSNSISELSVEAWQDSAAGHDGVPSSAQAPLDSNFDVLWATKPLETFHTPWISSQLIEPSTENDTAVQHGLSPEREHQSTSPPTSNFETSIAQPIDLSYQYPRYKDHWQRILLNRLLATFIPHSLGETPFKRRDSARNANWEAARAAITMPINGRDDEFICLYCQGRFLEDTVYILHMLSCLAVQDLYGDDEYQLLSQAALEEFVHTDRALSNLSPEFHTASTLQDSFGSQPQQQFHLDQETHALFVTEGAAATPIRIHGKYPCHFCPLEAKTFAPPDSLKRHEKPCSHRKQEVLSLPQHPTGSPVSDTSNIIGEGASRSSPQARVSPDSGRRSNLDVPLVHGECGTERIEDVINVCLVREADCQEHKSSTGHVDGDVANADTDQQEQVNEHPDASTNTGCGHAETGDRTTLGYETILSITLDRIIQELALLSNTSPQVQIRLNRIGDYYLQRDIEHAQEAEPCDIGSHKAKQSDVKERTGAMTKNTMSPAEGNDTHSEISKLKMILPELDEVDLSKIPKDELHYVLDVLSAVKTCS